MNFGREVDTGQAIRQHIGEAKDKPTLVGKALGAIGLDESGERARTPWGDAAISAAWMPYRFGESVWDALTAASDTLHGKHPLGAPIYSEEDAPPPSYVAQTDPTLLQRGLNFAGTVASSSPIAPKPTNAAGMFGGRLAAENLARAGETRPLRALELAEKLQKEGATREEIYAKTNEILKDSPYAGVSYPADKKPRFEISDDKARFTGKGNLGGENGDLLLSNAFNHRELYRAYPDMKRIQLGYEIDPNAPPFVMGGQYIDPSKTEFKFESGTRQGEPVGEAIGYTAPNKDVMRTGLLHEGSHAIQYREGFAKGTNPEAAANASPEVKAIDRKIADAYLRFNEAKTPAERMYVQSELDGLDHLREKTVAEVGYPTYRRYKGEEEARLAQTRADLTPDERRARPPWLDSDVPESQQIVRLSSNPDDVKASIPGTIVRNAPDEDIAAALATARDLNKPKLEGTIRNLEYNPKGDYPFDTPNPMR